MSSGNAYTVITPELTDFSVPHTPIPPGLNPSNSRGHREVHEEAVSNAEDKGSIPSRIHGWLAAHDVVQRNIGLLLVTASQAFFSLMDVAVQKLNSIDPPVTTFELIAVRMVITYVCCITYMIARKVPDPILGIKGVRLLLLFRGFIGFFGLFGVYYSLQYLSLSDATVLTFLTPMCSAMSGALFLGENFTRREALAGVVSLLGVVLIARPTAIFGSTSHSSVEKGTATERLIAVGVALVGVLGQTGAYTTIRAIGKRVHPLHHLAFFSSMSVVVSITGMIVTKSPLVIPTRIEWLALLFMIGVFGFLAQLLLTMALQREAVGRCTMALYTQIVFATILEKVVFHTLPTALSIIGTLLILASAIYVALTKQKEVPSNHKVIQLRLPQDVELEEGLLSSSKEERHTDKLDYDV